MPDDPDPPISLEYATPRGGKPTGNIGVNSAIGQLLLPAIMLELGGIALSWDKFFLFGLLLLPLGLSWLIVSTIRVAKLLRA